MPLGNKYNGPDDTVKLDFNQDGALGSGSETPLLNEIWNGLNLRDGRKIAIKKELLKVVLLNLYKGYKSKKSTAFSRKASFYSTRAGRYRRPIERYSLVKHIIDELEKEGFIEIEKGRSFKNPIYIGQLSKMFPTKKLIKLFEKFPVKRITKLPLIETVILKDNNKLKVPYEDDINTSSMRSEISVLNNLRSKAIISLKGVPNMLLNEYSKSKHKTYREILQPFTKLYLSGTTRDKLNIPLEKTYLHRVFNDSSFNKGGRFYGTAEITLPKKLRKYLTINDKSTVEMDYSCLHLHMMYHLKGIHFGDNPYLSEIKRLRELYKAITMTVINTNIRTSAIKAILKQHKDGELDLSWLNDVTYNKIEKYFKKWEKVHYKLKDQFYTNKGIDLMNLDSIIMSKILKHFSDKGIVACGIHDSVIIQKQFKKELLQIMVEVYEEVLGFKPVVK